MFMYILFLLKMNKEQYDLVAMKFSISFFVLAYTMHIGSIKFNFCEHIFVCMYKCFCIIFQ